MFTKLVSDIKYKIMEKTTGSSILSLPVFMGNNPPWLLQCLLEILSVIIFPKHLLDPVKKKMAMRNPSEIFPLHSHIFPYLQMCVYSHMATGGISALVYICLCVHMCLLHIFVHVYMYTCTHLLMCSHSSAHMCLVTYLYMHMWLLFTSSHMTYNMCLYVVPTYNCLVIWKHVLPRLQRMMILKLA